MIKKILYISTSYVGVEALGRLADFAFLAWLSRYTTTEEYGQVALFLSLVAFSQLGLSLGLENAITRYFYRFNTNPFSLQRYLGASLLALLKIALTLATLLCIIGYFINSYFSITPNFSKVAAPILIVSFCQVFSLTLFGLLKARKQVRKYITFSAINFALQIGLPIFFVNMSPFTVLESYLIGVSAASLCFVLLIALPSILREVKLYKRNLLTKVQIVYGLQMLPITLSMLLNRFLDRFILLSFAGLSAVGVYTAGYQVGRVLILLATALNSAYAPFFFELHEKQRKSMGSRNHQKLNEATSFIILLISSTLCSWLILSHHLFTYIYDERYLEAIHVLPFISTTAALTSIYFINTNALSLSLKLNRLKFVGVLLGLIVNLALACILTPRLGAVGVAICGMLGMLSTIIYFDYLVKNRTIYRFPNFRYLAVIGVSLVTYYISENILNGFGRSILCITLTLILAVTTQTAICILILGLRQKFLNVVINLLRNNTSSQGNI